MGRRQGGGPWGAAAAAGAPPAAIPGPGPGQVGFFAFAFDSCRRSGPTEPLPFALPRLSPFVRARISPADDGAAAPSQPVRPRGTGRLRTAAFVSTDQREQACQPAWLQTRPPAAADRSSLLAALHGPRAAPPSAPRASAPTDGATWRAAPRRAARWRWHVSAVSSQKRGSAETRGRRTRWKTAVLSSRQRSTNEAAPLHRHEATACTTPRRSRSAAPPPSNARAPLRTIGVLHHCWSC
eukprot:365322-Chlamydomonas_euryale.AAC.7